jgi:hypothetical protein
MLHIPEWDKQVVSIKNQMQEWTSYSAKELIWNLADKKISSRIAWENDRWIKSIKNTLAENIDFISKDDFALVTKRTIAQTQFPNNYACLFDYKVHSSKRRMYQQYANDFPIPPSYSWYFAPAFERINNEKTLHTLLEKWIHNFVILDDAMYSGEQVVNRQILPIQKFFSQYAPDITPTFHVIAPYIWKKAKDILWALPWVKLSIWKEMKTLGEYLTTEQKDILQNQNNIIDGLDCVQTTTLTYFAHKMPDAHSFSEVVRPHIDESKIYTPYKDEKSEYYKDDDIEFENYKNYIMSR